jgi:hypothetical protein
MLSSNYEEVYTGNGAVCGHYCDVIQPSSNDEMTFHEIVLWAVIPASLVFCFSIILYYGSAQTRARELQEKELYDTTETENPLLSKKSMTMSKKWMEWSFAGQSLHYSYGKYALLDAADESHHHHHHQCLILRSSWHVWWTET